jgi:DNA repair exonuclease SbcCD nuclease subunit
MTTPSQLLVTSDTHVGLVNDPGGRYDPNYQWQYALGLSGVVSLAIVHDVDAILHVGDIFNSEDPPSWAVTTVRAEFKRAHEAGIPIYYVAGNHDTTGADRYSRDERFSDALPTAPQPAPAIESAASELRVFELGSAPTLVEEDTALYSVPHEHTRNEEWFDQMYGVSDGDEPTGERFRIVCVHEGFNDVYHECERPLKPFLDRFDDDVHPHLLVGGHLHQFETKHVSTGEYSRTQVLYPGMPTDGKGTKSTNQANAALVTVPEPLVLDDGFVGHIAPATVEQLSVPTTQARVAALEQDASAALGRRTTARSDPPSSVAVDAFSSR